MKEAFQLVKQIKPKRKNAGSIMYSSGKSPTNKVNILQSFSQFLTLRHDFNTKKSSVEEMRIVHSRFLHNF